MAMKFVQESELREAQRGEIHTLTWRRTCYGANGGEDSIDGGGDQREKVTGDDGDDSKTRGGSAGRHDRVA